MANIITKRGSQDNVITYEHICDTSADMANIDRNYITLGSTCIVLSGQSGGMEVYMANTSRQWEPLLDAVGNNSTTPNAISLHICAQNEYDSENLIPTIAEPNDSTFYLVPASNETGNLYDEWVYVDGNWERFSGAPIPTYSNATIAQAGLMSAADKAKLDGFSSASNYITNVSGKADKTDTVLTNNLSIGRKADTTKGLYSIAAGYETQASADYSTAFGILTKATSMGAHAEGLQSTASGGYAHAEGQNTTASYGASHAEGQDTISSGAASHAEGKQTSASGQASHSEGVGSATAVEYYNYDKSQPYNRTTPHAVNSSIIPGASNEGAHAEGNLTVASGKYSHAEGSMSRAEGTESHTEGYYTFAGGQETHAEGSHTYANGINSHAEGNYTYANGGGGQHAEGYQSVATGQQGQHAEGYMTYAAGSQGQHAEGYYTRAEGNRGEHAEGNYTYAGGGGHAEGYGTYAIESGHAEGFGGSGTGFNSQTSTFTYTGPHATKEGAHAEGYGSSTDYPTASYYGAHAEGYGHTQALKSGAHAEGYLEKKADGEGAHAEGYGGTYTSNGETYAYGAYGLGAHSEGMRTIANGNGAHSEGSDTKASAVYAHAEGSYSTASANSAHSEGYNCTASGEESHAEGYHTTASGVGSHAEGSETTAMNGSDHAEGQGTIAKGHRSHAEGQYSEAFGGESHAEGYRTHANGTRSHAEGYETTANGSDSHTEGYTSTANGADSHSEGYHTIANGDYSHVEGKYTIGSGQSTHVFGEFNVDQADAIDTWEGNTPYEVNDIVKRTVSNKQIFYKCTTANTDETWNNSHWAKFDRLQFVEIVGNGIDANARTNARALDWNGNEYLNGTLYVNCDNDSTNGTAVATEQYVQNNYAPIANAELTGSIGLNRTSGTTVGTNSISLGYHSRAEGESSVAIGEYASAYATEAISIGKATRTRSHTETALGTYNYSEDPEDWVKDTPYSVGDTVRKSSKNYVCIEANDDHSFTSSKWVERGTTLLSVGNGTDSARSNAATLDWDGNLRLMGDVYVNANPDGTGGTSVSTRITQLESTVTALEEEIASLREALKAFINPIPQDSVVMEDNQPLTDEQGNILIYDTPTT